MCSSDVWGKPNVEISQDDGVDHGHAKVNGREELARERRLVAARAPVQGVEHLGFL
jgi:hypothetical protein